MADNITAPATGVVLATDDVGGVQYPRAKLALGADGAAVDAIGGAGAVSAAVQRMTLASDDPAVAALTAIQGFVDGLETLAAATNALLTTQNGYLDGVEALLGAATPAGTAIIGKVGVDQTTDGTTNRVNVDASLKSGTATRTTVNSGIASAPILAANPARKGATIYNSDANALLLDLSGGAAAATRCQVRLPQYSSYELGSGYTGAITGIWEADGFGIADVVEFT